MPIAKPSSTRPQRALLLAALGVLWLPAPLASAADPSGTDGGAAATVEPGPGGPGPFGRVSRSLAGWEVVIGAGARVAPEFEGSDEFDVTPVPFFRAQFGERITVDPRGLFVGLYQLENFRFGARLGYELGRDEDDSDRLDGLGDVDAGGVVGLTAAYELGPVTFNAGLDQTIGGSEGLLAILGAEVSRTLGRLTLSAGPSVIWADDNHMEEYFGVTRGQSGRSGLSRYEADAGFKRVELEASATYAVSEHWLVRGQLGVGYLVGDAGDSPIVEEEVQPSALLTLGYQF